MLHVSEKFTEKVAFWFCLPFFVVTMITPFAALEPYIAAEEASFSICMDSIMSGFRSDSRFVPVMGEVKEFKGTPSITHNGFENLRPASTSSELYPLTVIATSPPPGAPERLVMSSPATRPCKRLAMLADGIPLNSSAFTTETAPVDFLRVVVP